jgi:hypothetical protein
MRELLLSALILSHVHCTTRVSWHSPARKLHTFHHCILTVLTEVLWVQAQTQNYAWVYNGQVWNTIKHSKVCRSLSDNNVWAKRDSGSGKLCNRHFWGTRTSRTVTHPSADHACCSLILNFLGWAAWRVARRSSWVHGRFRSGQKGECMKKGTS